MRKTDSPKILILDVELSPIVAYVWQTFDVTVGLDQILEDWSVLAFCAKWLDGKNVIYRDTGGRGKNKVRDDRALLAELGELLDQADIVVGHNVKAFDLRKIRSRMLELGMPVPSPTAVCDTLQMARRAGAFTSNKLKFLCDKLTNAKKDSHSKFPGMALWRAVLEDDPKGWAAMREYNRADVLATEELYLKLRPWASGGVSLASFTDDDEPQCPTCLSTNLKPRGVAITATGKFVRLRCSDCNSWSRQRENLVIPNTRKKKLAKL